MTKEEKQLRKYNRCQRRKRRNYISASTLSDAIGAGLSISEARQYIRRGYFYNNSGVPMQICDYQGICSHPCNGDC